MRDRVAFAAIVVVLLFATGGYWLLMADLSAADPPDATFEITADTAAGELVVEHTGGDSVSSGSLRVLVYEDRPIVPDRTVHGSIWETDTGFVQPGDRIEIDDPRLEPGHRVVVRWFDAEGQANLHETTLP